MARLRRRWRVVKWVASSVLILIAIGWIISFTAHWSFANRHMGIGLMDGKLYVSSCPEPPPRRSSVRFLPPNPAPSGEGMPIANMECIYGIRAENATDANELSILAAELSPTSWWQPSTAGECVVLPLGIPLLAIALLTAYRFWLDRRHIPPHYCQNCGYDLTGNTSGVCPECGAKTPSQSPGRGA